MDEKIAREAMVAIEKAADAMDTQQKEHFASMLTILTKCYGKDAQWRGALLLSDDTKIISVGINSNEYELIGLINEAAAVFNADIKAEAPENGLYN